MSGQPLNKKRKGLIPPTEQEFEEMMALWEEGRREQRKTSLQMRLEMALQMLWRS